MKAFHIVYNKFNLLHSNPTSASSSSLFILLITVLTLNFDTFFTGYPLMKMHAEFVNYNSINVMHSDFYVLFYFFKMYQWFCFITDFVFYFLQWLCINFRLKYWRKCSLNKYCIRWIPLTAVEYELISESAYIFTCCV